MWSGSLGDSDFLRSARILTRHSRKSFMTFLCVVRSNCGSPAEQWEGTLHDGRPRLRQAWEGREGGEEVQAGFPMCLQTVLTLLFSEGLWNWLFESELAISVLCACQRMPMVNMLFVNNLNSNHMIINRWIKYTRQKITRWKLWKFCHQTIGHVYLLVSTQHETGGCMP